MSIKINEKKNIQYINAGFGKYDAPGQYNTSHGR